MASAAVAMNRFGLGARGDEAPPADAKAWLKAQLDRFEPRPSAVGSVPSRADVAGELADFYQQLQAMGGRRGRGARAKGAAAEPMPMPMSGEPAEPMAAGDPLAGTPQELRRYVRQASRGAYLASVGARMETALTSPAPFIERLVHFWANHFAVSADKLEVIGVAGLLEFEAIRPHVLGRFSDMLLAVERHPAMLLYLDQAQSIGPGSPFGARAAAAGRRKVGLNENLAREILELHTLGVRTGYSQADVTEFARALTGWTVSGMTRGPAARVLGIADEPGRFTFAPRLHEPGTRTIMGRSYDQEGEAQARAVLADLAVHPATAKHLATKLARHFVADDPPAALVGRLSAAFLKSGGDLPTLYRALIDAPEAWAPQAAKFKTPWDWSVSALRAVGTRRIEGQAVNGLLDQLGQPVWRPGSPAGFDDVEQSWAGPDALMRRVEAAERIAGRAGDALDARALAGRVLPGAVTAATQQAIARAESPGQGLALLLVAPEFMRR